MKVNRERQHISLGARSVWLALIAVASFMVYWGLLSVSLSPEISVVHNVKGATYSGPLTWPSNWLHLTEATPDVLEWFFVLAMVALSLLWLAAIYLVRRDRSKALTIVIVGGFAAFAGLFLVGPVFQSTDVYYYIFSGRTMSVYHANPYTMTPMMRPHDVFFPLTGWKDIVSVYGPLFSLASFGITKVADSGIWANVLAFKILAVASYAACLPLVYSLARRVSPGKENMSLAIAAWCPVLVMHVAGGAHNDILAVAFVLGGLLLYRKGRLLPGLALVALAAAVKMTAGLALIPLFVLYVRDRGGAPLKRLVAGGLTCFAVVALPYAPFWAGTRIFDGARQVASLYSATSVPMLVSYQYQRLLTFSGMAPVKAEAMANGSVHMLSLAVFLAGAFLLLRRVKDFRSMAVCTASLSLLWLLTSTYLLPWYIVLGIMVAAFTGWNLTTGLMVATATVLTFYRLPASGDPMGGPTVYIALPLLIILVGWAFLDKLERRRTSASLDRVLFLL